VKLDRLFENHFDESHVEYRHIVRRFATEEIAPHAEKWEEDQLFDVALYRKAAEAGVLGPSFPEGYGGGGGDIFHGIVAGEELQRGGCTGAVMGLGSLAISIPPILLLGTEEQKQRFIPPVLAGEKIAALAITEPDAGSDVAGVRTRAVLAGDHYVMNGAKTFITSGVRADIVVVLARTGDDPHGGLTFFVVEKGMEGFSVSRALKKTGWWASDTAELAFVDVKVPVANRLGAEGTGFIALMQNFESERLMLAVNGYAIAQIAFEEALRYANERQAFGRSIVKFQVIKHKLAEMATKIVGAKALTYQCAARMNEGQKIPAEVAMAKNLCAEVAQSVCWEAVQIHGGMGYMRESLVERLSRDARLLPIGGGTHEVMNEIICRMMGFAK
jgi:acyl-CoA dehydrogenase